MNCKFEVTSITAYAGMSGVKVLLSPAMYKESLKIIPTGKIELMVDDPNIFEVGKEYDVSFKRSDG